VFLGEKLPEMLGEIPLSVRRNMWFQYDMAAAQFACQVQEYLTTTYSDRWNGQGGPMAWPPRSPDLIPMDVFLWGHTKALISISPVDSEAISLPVLLRQQ